MKLLVVAVVFAIAALSAIPAHALLYTFTGANGLSGTFTLDETVPIAVTTGPSFVEGVHDSPLNHISGQFGDYVFEGDARLIIFDALVDSFAFSDHWIIRADITSPEINGLSLSKLNLFIFRSPGVTTPMSVEPPLPDVLDEVNFQYTVVFSDQSFIAAPLTSLVFVPEPSSLVLTLAAGGIGTVVGVLRRKNRRAE